MMGSSLKLLIAGLKPVVLGLFVLAIPCAAYSVSPTSWGHNASLQSSLDENDSWIFCETRDTQPSEAIEKYVERATEFSCLNFEKPSKFVSGLKVFPGETYLIFDPEADFILLPDYSVSQQEKPIPDTIIDTSKFGKISGALRVVSIQIQGISEEYVMVPNEWAYPGDVFKGVGAMKRDHSISLPCCMDGCDPEDLAYYLVPKGEVISNSGLN